MPRYFFHIHDGHSVLDDVGLDLPDISAARTTAIELSGEILLCCTVRCAKLAGPGTENVSVW